VYWLSRKGVATRETFVLLLPGIFVACLSPDAACSPEGDLHPPGIIGRVLLAVVNVAFYGALVYWISKFFRRQHSK
jgi:hypothetical protein